MIALASALLPSTAEAAGAGATVPASFVTMISQPGDYIGGGLGRYYHEATPTSQYRATPST